MPMVRDMGPLQLTLLLSLLRYIYLECEIHDKLYSFSNGWYNGYIVIALMALLLGIPPILIAGIVFGRMVYRSCVGSAVYNKGNHPFNVIIFFIGIYIALCLKR